MNEEQSEPRGYGLGKTLPRIRGSSHTQQIPKQSLTPQEAVIECGARLEGCSGCRSDPWL